MPRKLIKKPIYDLWILDPMKRFMSHSSTSGIVLFGAAIFAIVISNSPLAEWYHNIWKVKLAIGYGDHFLSKDLHHWINDGLMAVFFFVVGLELKREIIAGELKTPRKAVMPLAAAVGGMVVPAAIYLLFNDFNSVTGSGWGIPMATDIAFALGILYLLGDRVPISLKIFLTALAIADDLGAVLVIAFFYTSDINLPSLLMGGVFMAVLVVANLIGVRSTLFYGIVGVAGLWLAFLMSGVHATIAAVLAAFTIPARVYIPGILFSRKLSLLMARFKKVAVHESIIVSTEQQKILEEIKVLTKEASTPLQHLEHSLHPLVAFIVMPIFALANAGVSISGENLAQIGNSVTMGVFFGLIVGKFIGVVGTVALIKKLNISPLPSGTNMYHIIGAGFLASIGFTMSLFIAELAFVDEHIIEQAKLGIIFASFFASVVGYFTIKMASPKKNVVLVKSIPDESVIEEKGS